MFPVLENMGGLSEFSSRYRGGGVAWIYFRSASKGREGGGGGSCIHVSRRRSGGGGGCVSNSRGKRGVASVTIPEVEGVERVFSVYFWEKQREGVCMNIPRVERVCVGTPRGWRRHEITRRARGTSV